MYFYGPLSDRIIQGLHLFLLSYRSKVLGITLHNLLAVAVLAGHKNLYDMYILHSFFQEGLVKNFIFVFL
jgi:hypothetical protein